MTVINHQISLTEWFEQINHSQKEEIRREDVTKRERLGVLNELIGLPFDKPTTFEAEELLSNSPRWHSFFVQKASELCALRLNPKNPALPKLRIKGEKLVNAYDWFKTQTINPTNYKVDIMPFAGSYAWSGTFVVNNNGIFGEVIRGSRTQLAWGEYENNRPSSFSSNFGKIWVSDSDPLKIKTIESWLEKIKVTPHQQELIQSRLNAKFYNGYIAGYFEATVSDAFGLVFVDYNRILGDEYSDFRLIESHNIPGHVTGRVGHPGKVKGVVHIVRPSELSTVIFKENEILVCETTTPDYVAVMSQARAIVTDKGGILSHAAIIARELNKPCVVATTNATEILKDGDFIEVDANSGQINLLKS